MSLKEGKHDIGKKSSHTSDWKFDAPVSANILIDDIAKIIVTKEGSGYSIKQYPV
jgi:hypothetical protein